MAHERMLSRKVKFSIYYHVPLNPDLEFDRACGARPGQIKFKGSNSENVLPA